MTFSIRWIFLIVSCGFTRTLTAPLCPCPGGKWMPPFRPSQLLYSEFPEDRGRSLHIDRQSGYETNSIDPPPPPYSRPYNHDTTSDEYDVSLEPPNNSLQSTEYSDYEDVSNEAVDSHDYSSDEASSELYNGGYSEYRENKDSKADQGSNSREDVKLNEAVEPPQASDEEKGEDSQEDPPPTSVFTKSKETTRNPPSTQLEVPHVGELPPVQPTSPLQVNYNSLVAPPPPRPPLSGILRSPFHPVTSGLLAPQHSGYSHWRNVVDEAELSNLRVMKPPPLGQAQTWRATVHRSRRRPA